MTPTKSSACLVPTSSSSQCLPPFGWLAGYLTHIQILIQANEKQEKPPSLYFHAGHLSHRKSKNVAMFKHGTHQSEKM